MGDKEKAMQLYEYALKINVNDWQAHNNKGVIHKEAGELEKSVYHYRIAVKEGPQTDNIAKRNLAIALTDLGTRLQTQGKISASIELFIEAVTVDSTYEMAYFNLGVVYERSNPSKAIESYLRAVACKPNYAEALCNIGVIYKSKSDLPKAIAFYERALVANPNFEIAINNLAIAVTDFGTQVKYSGQLQSAISYYKKALTYNPHYSPAW